MGVGKLFRRRKVSGGRGRVQAVRDSRLDFGVEAAAEATADTATAAGYGDDLIEKLRRRSTASLTNLFALRPSHGGGGGGGGRGRD